jgi:hypothetical protein
MLRCLCWLVANEPAATNGANALDLQGGFAPFAVEASAEWYLVNRSLLAILAVTGPAVYPHRGKNEQKNPGYLRQ